MNVNRISHKSLFPCNVTNQFSVECIEAVAPNMSSAKPSMLFGIRPPEYRFLLVRSGDFASFLVSTKVCYCHIVLSINTCKDISSFQSNLGKMVG